jgi:YaiO family outer membrane protein
MRRFRSFVALFALTLFLSTTTLAADPDLQLEIDASIARGDNDYALSLVNDYLADHADDSNMRFRKAQILGRQSKHDAALREYEILLARYPDDVDFIFGHAQILMQQDASERALVDLRHASELAPDYEDVWRLYYRALSLQSRDTTSGEMQRVREHAALQFPDAGWWHELPEAESPAWTLQAGGSIEHLSGGLAGWNSGFAEVSYSGATNQRYFARGSRDERFGQSDVQLSAGADWQLPDDWFAGAAIASSAGAAFLPRSQYDLHAGRQVAKGWVIGLGYRRRSYASDTVTTLNGTLERYFGDFRAAWTLGVSALNSGSDSVGQVLGLNWYLNDATSFGASINFGEEAEAIAPGLVLKTRVRGATLTGRYQLNDRVSLDWWLGIHEQGDLYRRQYAGMAVSVGI